MTSVKEIKCVNGVDCDVRVIVLFNFSLLVQHYMADILNLSHILCPLFVYTSGDTVGIHFIHVCVSVCVCVADWEGKRKLQEGSRVCLSVLKVSLRKGLFLIVSAGCVCFVFADLPVCMQMVPWTTGASKAHISLCCWIFFCLSYNVYPIAGLFS